MLKTIGSRARSLSLNCLPVKIAQRLAVLFPGRRHRRVPVRRCAPHGNRTMASAQMPSNRPLARAGASWNRLLTHGSRYCVNGKVEEKTDEHPVGVGDHGVGRALAGRTALPGDRDGFRALATAPPIRRLARRGRRITAASFSERPGDQFFQLAISGLALPAANGVRGGHRDVRIAVASPQPRQAPWPPVVA